MILADCPELKKIHWSCVIIDEAHRLKNRNCKLLEGLKLMALVRVASSLYEQRLLLFAVEKAFCSHLRVAYWCTVCLLQIFFLPSIADSVGTKCFLVMN